MEEAVIKKLNTFFESYQNHVYKIGDIIFLPGEEIIQIAYLKKGLVKMYIISEEGIEATIHVFRQGSFFPIMLAISSHKNKYYFEAMEDVETIKAPAQEVIAFIRNDPEILFDLTVRFGDAITGLMLRIEQLVSQTAYSKIVSLLLYWADTYRKKDENRYVIDLNFSHDQIGTWVGVARETVSRQMEKLEKKGIISHKNHQIVINDFEKLKKEVSK